MASSRSLPRSIAVPVKVLAAIVLLSPFALGFLHMMGVTEPSGNGRSFGMIWSGMLLFAVWAACTLCDRPTPWALVSQTVIAFAPTRVAKSSSQDSSEQS